MKRIRIALVALILCFSLVYMGGEEVWAAAKKHYGRSCVDNSCATGYDLSDVTGMTDGDTAVVPADPTYGGPLHYLWDEDSGLTEDLPDVKDADIAGNGRWILQKLPIQAGGTGAPTASAARTALSAQQQDDQLDDLAALSPGIGGVPYWDTISTMSVLAANPALVGYMLQVVGTSPNALPSWVNTIDVTKIIFPNATSPTTDTQAQCSWDTDNRAMECFDDTSQLLATLEKCEDITLATPDDLQGESDDWPLKHFVAESYPGGVTITAIHVTTEAACSDSIDFEEWSSAYAFQNSVETMTLSGTQTEDDGIDSAILDVDEYLVVDLDGTSPCDVSWFHITICYQIEDN